MAPNICEACGGREVSVAYRRHGHSIARCSQCGLLFVADPPSGEALAALYEPSFFQTGHKFASGPGGSSGARRNAARRLRAIDRPAGTLLDVGCATGDFLLEARRQGWKVAGVEWSRYAAEEARRRGLDVQNASFPEAQFSGERFDVITFWDYIEHVAEPSRHLLHAHSLLRPGGLLILSTGDTASLFAWLSGRHWHLMIPPKHLFFFSRSNIRAMLERTGFDVEWIRWPGKHVNLGFLADKAGKIFPSPATRLLARLAEKTGIGRFDAYINLRDIMTVGAVRQG